MAKIRVENVSKVFNAHSRNKNRVLKGVSFELPEKGLVAIFGKSGSGKTTLLNIIGGLDRQDGGKVYIDGVNTAGRTDNIRNAEIGYIFQNYYLERGYTIAEIMRNQMLIAGFKDEGEIARRTEAVLRLVDMERYKNKRADALSGGQQQRVAIARALVKGSDVILADEPTGNLDAENTTKVMEILKAVSRTQLVVLVTHELSLIEKYADSHIKVVDGELVVDEADGLNRFRGTAPSEEIGRTAEPNPAPRQGASPENQPSAAQNSIEPPVTQPTDNQPPAPQSNETQPSAPEVAFTKSGAKRNGRLFTFKRVFQLFRFHREEKQYSTSVIFKQLFIAAMAVVMTFFAFSAYEALNATAENKQIAATSVYVDMTTDNYKELRRIKEDYYETIDFFETQFKEGDFSYNNIASLSGLKVDYIPRSLSAAASFEELYGAMPQAGEVLITRALAERLKEQLRLQELNNDRSLLLMIFEDDYAVSGIVEGEEPAVYFNRVDYVNFLGVYGALSISDPNLLFLEQDYTANTFTTEICLAEESVGLADNEATIEINRNSLYKMMSDVTQADYRANLANSRLTMADGSTATAIYITDSKPMYVQKINITRDAMTTDLRIYVNERALNNIFVYLSPNVDALEKSVSSTGAESQYYFEITTTGASQLEQLKTALRGISSVDIVGLYEKENAEAVSAATQGLTIFVVVIVLLLLIYYFIEKSGSIKNSKEYGIYRAIGVNRSNLLFKEAFTAFMCNIVSYFVYFLITTVLIVGRYAVLNAAFGGFIGLAAATFAASAVVMTGISILPYLFVLTQTPAKILTKYDI